MMSTQQRALIVDDDSIWLSALAGTLRYAGFDVRTATDLDEARDQLEHAHLVISEVFVRNEACFSFLRAACMRTVAPRIIAISDRAPRAMVFKLRDYPISAYLEKPISRAALLRCLAQLDPQPAQAPAARNLFAQPDAASAEALEVVLQRYRAAFRLTRSECEILRCATLGTNRAEIAAERCTSTNTIKTQIRALLRKSDAPTLRALVRRVVASAESCSGESTSKTLQATRI